MSDADYANDALADAELRISELTAELSALQQRLHALENPDDEDARTPAGLRAANAQLRKECNKWSAMVGQLRGQLQECEAGAAAMREVLDDLWGYMPSETAESDLERADAKQLRPKLEAALSSTAGTALLEELRSLREAKDVKPETTPA